MCSIALNNVSSMIWSVVFSILSSSKSSRKRTGNRRSSSENEADMKFCKFTHAWKWTYAAEKFQVQRRLKITAGPCTSLRLNRKPRHSVVAHRWSAGLTLCCCLSCCWKVFFGRIKNALLHYTSAWVHEGRFLCFWNAREISLLFCTRLIGVLRCRRHTFTASGR